MATTSDRRGRSAGPLRSLLAVGTGVLALALALVGLTFPGVIAGALAAWLGGMAWSESDKDVALVALGCGGLALAIGFIALVQTAYPG